MKVVIINTGCANLASLYYAIAQLGYHVQISDDAKLIKAADRLLLPGVGSANTAMTQLKQKSLVEVIQSCHQPILGICLGMQLMAKQSEEGMCQTLAIINETVSRLQSERLPLPHIGWNKVIVPTDHFLFKGIANKSYYYFVHGYALPITPYTIAYTFYEHAFSAAIQYDHFFGVQFHPERSGNIGACLLQNFVEVNL